MRLLVLLTLAACTEPADELPRVEQEPGPAFEAGDPVSCGSPTSGMDRYTEVANERGLTGVPVPEDHPEYPWLGFERMVVAEDIDLDGDVDVVLAGDGGLPEVFLNDGDASFTAAPTVPAGDVDEPDLFALADLDGNRLPDLVGNQHFNGGWFAPNLGDGTFGPIQQLAIPDADEHAASSLIVGDIDADGDLDGVLVPNAEDYNIPFGPPTLILRNSGGELTWDGAVGHPSQGIPSIGTTFTDRDWDGTLEILQPTTTRDFGLLTAFWHRDGDGWEDRAPELGFDLGLAAMGSDSSDLNGDGVLDYCISDVGDPLCMVSAGPDAYVDSGQALGIAVADPPVEGPTTVGWAVEFADLDNDGRQDLLHASGFDRSGWDDGLTGYPDKAWRQTEAGTFEDVSAAMGIDLPEDHYGIAAADFDGNGWLDVLTAATNGPPRLFLAACGSEAWLTIELAGSSANPSAIGARIEVEAGGRTQIDELVGPRGSGQSPTSFHVGLGDADLVDRLTILWPDGEETEALDLGVRRQVLARHPEFVQ